jgi:hypothetical protein
MKDLVSESDSLSSTSGEPKIFYRRTVCESNQVQYVVAFHVVDPEGV